MTHRGPASPDTFDLTVRRLLDAPVERVWAAWSESDLVTQWWGPAGFTCPVAVLDVRVGGVSLVCMRAPQEYGGQDSYNTWTYTEIVPCEGIAFTLRSTDPTGAPLDPADLGIDAGVPAAVPHVVGLTASGPGRTELTVTEYGYGTEQARRMSRAGLEQCLDKMAVLLTGEPSRAS